MQSSRTLCKITQELLISGTCSKATQELSKVTLDCVREYTGATESTYSCGGAFRMLCDFTYRIVKLWSSCNLYAGLQETSWVAKTSAHLWVRRGTIISASCSAGSITTWDFIHHIYLCFSHKIYYIIMWHLLSKYLHIYSYTQSGSWHYLSVIGGVRTTTNQENLGMNLGAIVVGVYISHCPHQHHHQYWFGRGKLAGCVWRYRDNGNKLSNQEYIFGWPLGK